EGVSFDGVPPPSDMERVLDKGERPSRCGVVAAAIPARSTSFSSSTIADSKSISLKSMARSMVAAR
ncbi:hypothetical protein CH063_13124, partial [Colletotrichum higginsianum]